MTGTNSLTPLFGDAYVGFFSEQFTYSTPFKVLGVSFAVVAFICVIVLLVKVGEGITLVQSEDEHSESFVKRSLPFWMCLCLVIIMRAFAAGFLDMQLRSNVIQYYKVEAATSAMIRASQRFASVIGGSLILYAMNLMNIPFITQFVAFGMISVIGLATFQILFQSGLPIVVSLYWICGLSLFSMSVLQTCIASVFIASNFGKYKNIVLSVTLSAGQLGAVVGMFLPYLKDSIVAVIVVMSLMLFSSVWGLKLLMVDDCSYQAVDLE